MCATTFTKFTGSLGYLHSLGGPFSVALQGIGQYSFKPLIEGEQISFGGTQFAEGMILERLRAARVEAVR